VTSDHIASLRQRAAEIHWHHTIDLGHGIVTAGKDNTPRKLARLALPDSFAGMSVLDVGAWDGFFSFEAERRGAARVLATDSFAWHGNVAGFSKEGFDFAKQALGSHVEEMHIDALELSADKVGTWDVVFFLGVLYHMKHPLLALEKVADVTGNMLVLETLVDMLSSRRPAFAFYAGSEVAQDETNWCGPNPAAVAAMLRTVGFKRVEVVSGARPLHFRVARSLWHRYNSGHQFWTGVRTDRIVVHAWK
jgi:tRNA (mo5U34)-methyltransferase